MHCRGAYTHSINITGLPGCFHLWGKAVKKSCTQSKTNIWPSMEIPGLQYFLQQIIPCNAMTSSQCMWLMGTWYSYRQTWSEHESFYPEQCAKECLSALFRPFWDKIPSQCNFAFRENIRPFDFSPSCGPLLSVTSHNCTAGMKPQAGWSTRWLNKGEPIQHPYHSHSSEAATVTCSQLQAQPSVQKSPRKNSHFRDPRHVRRAHLLLHPLGLQHTVEGCKPHP